MKRYCFRAAKEGEIPMNEFDRDIDELLAKEDKQMEDISRAKRLLAFEKAGLASQGMKSLGELVEDEIEKDVATMSANSYEYSDYFQNQLKRAIEVLRYNPYRNNYTEEALAALETISTTRLVYKKVYTTGELVKVGQLTSKNEILFDVPKTSLYSMTKNLGRNSSIYYPGWVIFVDVLSGEDESYVDSQREEYLSYFDITNRHQFQEVLYYSGKRDMIDICECSVLGFMLCNHNSTEVVFYDQYR